MSKPVLVYTYSRCSTCRRAVAWLVEHGIPYEERPIYTEPPSRDALRRMLAEQGGEVRRLFNTSGLEYRARGLKDRLATLSTEEALTLLASEGRLVKRPFLLADRVGLLGFREEAWAKALLPR